MDNKKNNVIPNIVFAFKIIYQYAPLVSSLYAFIALASAFFTPLQILFLQRLVDSVSDFLNNNRPVRTSALWGGLYILSLFGSQMFWFFQAKLSRFMNRRLLKSLSPEILDKFKKIDYQYFETSRFRDIVTRMGDRPDKIFHNVFFTVIVSTNCLIQLIGVVGVFFYASLWIGIGAALIGIPMSILDYRAAEKKYKLLREATEDQRLGEYLQGLFSDKHSAYEIKIFRAKNHLLDLWHEVMNKIIVRYHKITISNLKVSAIVSLLKIAYTSFAVITLTIGFISGNIGLGVLVSVISAVGTLFSVLSETSRQASGIGEATFKINDYKEFMIFTERQEKTSNGIPQNMDIIFDKVSFTYPGTERRILHNISFTIKSGEKSAIVGVNGAGKSTIIKLLCGLYKPDSGHIFIGGKDVTTLSQDDIRHTVSVVFQDFGCYQMTLRENVAFGDLSQLDNDEQLIEALQLASADEILAKGLDANLGQLTEDGIDISKGQWQRIAISRAFLSHSDFIILDEPTASLDPIAESNMYEAFAKVLRKRGTIIISHRLASAKMADKIIVIEDGEIVGIGNHEELMKESGLYAVMFEEQSSWYQSMEEVTA